MLTHQRSSAVRLFALVFAAVAGLAVVFGVTLDGAQAQPGSEYRFTRVVDSEEDGFVPFNFDCSAINNRGDIAFRADREARRGNQLIRGIYRADAGKREGDDDRRRTKLTTVFEVGGRGEELDSLGQIPSINDEGEVSFTVSQFDERDSVFTQRVMRGSGGRPVTIADTEGDFNRFGGDPTINNSDVVAFKARLDDFDQGLFSGRGGRRDAITTHYLASNSRFSEFGSLSRPSINNPGDIAFEESVDGVDANGIFIADGSGIETIAEPDPNVNVDRPNLNDGGTVTFHRFFDDRAGEELMRGDSAETLTTVADTNGPFRSFGFYFGFTPPALNNHGDVAFLADLDSGSSGIFTGPDPRRDRVIGTGDKLDKSTITSLRFCDDGLNDSGQLVFQATFDDPGVPEGERVAIYRATPRR